ncbi:hypothetical protein EBR66_03380 [bacterium]|nr:hypothetical protein [bacterium]
MGFFKTLKNGFTKVLGLGRKITGNMGSTGETYRAAARASPKTKTKTKTKTSKTGSRRAKAIQFNKPSRNALKTRKWYNGIKSRLTALREGYNPFSKVSRFNAKAARAMREALKEAEKEAKKTVGSHSARHKAGLDALQAHKASQEQLRNNEAATARSLLKKFFDDRTEKLKAAYYAQGNPNGSWNDSMTFSTPYTNQEKKLVNTLSKIIEGIIKPKKGIIGKIRTALEQYKIRRNAERLTRNNQKQQILDAREEALRDIMRRRGYRIGENSSYRANAERLQGLNNPFNSAPPTLVGSPVNPRSSTRKLSRSPTLQRSLSHSFPETSADFTRRFKDFRSPTVGRSPVTQSSTRNLTPPLTLHNPLSLLSLHSLPQTSVGSTRRFKEFRLPNLGRSPVNPRSSTRYSASKMKEKVD